MFAKGYTLVELMVVVAIIGILGSIAYPSYQSYTCDTYKAQAVADLRVCALQMDSYYSNAFSYLGAVIDATTASTCKNRSPAEGAKKFDIIASISISTGLRHSSCARSGRILRISHSDKCGRSADRVVKQKFNADRLSTI